MSTSCSVQFKAPDCEIPTDPQFKSFSFLLVRAIKNKTKSEQSSSVLCGAAEVFIYNSEAKQTGFGEREELNAEI